MPFAIVQVVLHLSCQRNTRVSTPPSPWRRSSTAAGFPASGRNLNRLLYSHRIHPSCRNPDRIRPTSHRHLRPRLSRCRPPAPRPGRYRSTSTSLIYGTRDPCSLTSCRILLFGLVRFARHGVASIQQPRVGEPFVMVGCVSSEAIVVVGGTVELGVRGVAQSELQVLLVLEAAANPLRRSTLAYPGCRWYCPWRSACRPCRTSIYRRRPSNRNSRCRRRYCAERLLSDSTDANNRPAPGIEMDSRVFIFLRLNPPRKA